MAKIIRERVITDTIEFVGDTVKKLPKPPKKSSGCSPTFWVLLIIIVIFILVGIVPNW